MAEGDDDKPKQDTLPLDLVLDDATSFQMTPEQVDTLRPLVQLLARKAAREWFCQTSVK